MQPHLRHDHSETLQRLSSVAKDCFFPVNLFQTGVWIHEKNHEAREAESCGSGFYVD